MSEYNEKYSIPEMINTFKVVSSKLYKDTLWLVLLLYYIFILKDKIKIFDITFAYNGINIIIILGIFIVLLFSLLNNLNKVFILYRQLDDELKYRYSLSDKPVLRDYLNAACNLTSFAISNNFLTDFIITGNKRHPSLRRYIVLYISIFIISVIIITKLLYDMIDYHIILIIMTSSFLSIIIIYLMISRNYVIKSSFLVKSENIKSLIEVHHDLITRINTDINSYDGNDSYISTFVSTINNYKLIISTIDYNNVFDDTSYLDFIINSVTEINTTLAKISPANIGTLHTLMNMNSNSFINEKIRLIKDKYENVTKTTRYTLTLNHNKLHYDANNFISFSYYGLIGKITHFV